MASGWVKSLQCKSRAYEDVYHPIKGSLIPSGSCRHKIQSIRDVIDTKTKLRSAAMKKNKKEEAEAEEGGAEAEAEAEAGAVGSLRELPEGHPSRNVVDIIFRSSWSRKAFTGRVEVIFKIRNGTRAVARFEEYREALKSSTLTLTLPLPKRDPRCAADGNEVMGFHSLPGPGPGPTATVPKGWPICTYSASGPAHHSVASTPGTRAMLLCRVLAGRLGLDSLSRDGGALLVFDSRAVLPCFLIIYKL